MTKKRKTYCDREFDDEKVLITHQKAKHFKCMYCHKKLNSASGLVIHVAQIHKEAISIVPNSIAGHDTPELEIFGMGGVPSEDLARHQRGEPPVAFKRLKISETELLPLLAAQKASIPESRSKSITSVGTSSSSNNSTGLNSLPPPSVASVTSMMTSPSLGMMPTAAPGVAAGSAPGMMVGPPPNIGLVTSTTGMSSFPSIPLIPPHQSHSFMYHPPSIRPFTFSMSAVPSIPPTIPVNLSPPIMTSTNAPPHDTSIDTMPIIPSSTTILIPASLDESSGKKILAQTIFAPDLIVSMEERRAALTRYRSHPLLDKKPLGIVSSTCSGDSTTDP